MKKFKFLRNKRGAISSFGVLIALLSVIMLCGYLDLTQTTHVMEEIQSVMDLTALSTLQGSLDSDGVRFDRMTIRSYEYFVPNVSTGISLAEQQKINSETNKDTLLTMLKADGSLAETTIWIDGTNAENVNQIKVKNILLNNFNYYLQKLLYTGEGEHTNPLFDYSDSNLNKLTDYNGSSIIKKYEIRSFDAQLIYSSWGVDAEAKEGYQKIPQAYIDTTIVLYLKVEPTFSSMNIQLEESHVYNALTGANSSSLLHVEGYTEDGLLAVSVRTLARITVQGFILSEETPTIENVKVSYDDIPFTPEEYFDIDDAGTVTGFSQLFYDLPQDQRPKTIKMPTSIRGVSPVKIGDSAFTPKDGETIIAFILPESIQEFGKEAFAEATSLQNIGFITTPDLNKMGEGVFKNCTALEYFATPKNVKVIPDSAFEGCTKMRSFTFASGTTEIGDYAFKGCKNLKSQLSLPDTVMIIGKEAFFECSAIPTIAIPKALRLLGTSAFGKMTGVSVIKNEEGNTKFEVIDNVLYRLEGDGTYSLILYPAKKKNQTFTIPTINGKLVTQIGDYAFYDNSSLQEILYTTFDTEETKEMLHGIRIVGNNAFEKCSSLKELQFAGNLTDDAGNIIRIGLEAIGSNAFSATSSTTLIYIDKLKDTVPGSPWGANTNVTTIQWKADDSFDWSKIYSYTKQGKILGLTDYGADLVLNQGLQLVIPAVIRDEMWGEVHIQAIGANAFSCRKEDNAQYLANQKITQIVIAAPINKIEDNAFRETRMTSFVLSETVGTLGAYAFANSAIQTCSITGNGPVIIGDGAFMGSAIREYKIGSNAITVGKEVFKDCSQLAEVQIEASLTELKDSMFYGCESLTSIEIPSTVTTLGDYCFYGCSILSSIGANNNLEHVGKSAFSGCQTINQLWFTSNIQSIGELAFFNTPNLKQVNLAVEEDSVAGAPWGAASFTEIIWLNSKWVKFYTYERVGVDKWKITGLSDYGKQEIQAGRELNLETPTRKDEQVVVGFTFSADDVGYADKVLSMKIHSNYNNYEIYDEAFMECFALTSISLPKGVTTIGENAFACCENLKQMLIPDTVTTIGPSAFIRCINLEIVTLSKNVTVIDDFLFQDCRSLKEFVPYGNITVIGTKAFAGCDSLDTFHIQSSTISIGDYAFFDSGLTTVTSDNNSLTQFNTGIFKGCDDLVEVDLPSSVKSIGTNAFTQCIHLERLNGWQTSKLETINASAFSGCESFDTLQSFPELKDIAESAFANSGLVTIKSQPKLSIIDDYSFKSCVSLVTIESQPALTSIGTYAFSECHNLTTVGDLKALTNLESTAFGRCESLKTVGSLESLPVLEDVFTECYSLVSIANLDSLTKICEGAFNSCYALTTVPRSDKLTTIEANAFFGCSSLRDITLGTSISTIDTQAFNTCTDITIRVMRPEFNDVQTNSNRKRYINASANRATDPWGATTATVIWDNTLKINGTVIGSNTVITGGVQKLDAKTATKTASFTWTYNGDVGDLTRNYTVNVEYLNGYDDTGVSTVSFQFQKSCSGAKTFAIISDKYGKKGSVTYDVDDSILLAQTSVNVTDTFYSDDSTNYNQKNIELWYSGDESKLSITTHFTDYVSAYFQEPSNVTMGNSVDGSCDKVITVHSALYGSSGKSDINITDGTVSVTLSVGAKKAIKMSGSNTSWEELYGMGSFDFLYTGSGNKLSSNASASLNAKSQPSSLDGAGNDYSWLFEINGKGTMTVTDAGSSNDSTYSVSLPKVTIDWNDWWTNNEQSIATWKLSADVWQADSINQTRTFTVAEGYYKGPFTSSSYFKGTVQAWSNNGWKSDSNLTCSFYINGTIPTYSVKITTNKYGELQVSTERKTVTYDGRSRPATTCRQPLPITILTTS